MPHASYALNTTALAFRVIMLAGTHRATEIWNLADRAIQAHRKGCPSHRLWLGQLRALSRASRV